MGLRRDVDDLDVLRCGEREQEVAEMGGDLGRGVAEVVAGLDQPINDAEHLAPVTDGDRVGQREVDVEVGRADQPRDLLDADLAPTQDGGLLEQGERVADRTVCLPSDGLRRVRVELDALGDGHLAEVCRDQVGGHATELEPLGAPDDRGGHLVRLGGGEDEPHAGGRLLEQLQQRVERFTR
jgi:hypothetical protein